MLLYISILGILLSFILFFFNVKLFRSTVYLAGFLFLSTLMSLNIYVLYYSKSVLLVSVVLIFIKFSIFLNGPMLYWYIRSTLRDNPLLSRTDVLHLVPAALIFLTTLPYIFSTVSEKFGIASDLIMNVDDIMTGKQPVLFYLIPAKFLFAAQSMHALIYFFVSSWMVIGYVKTRKKNQVLSSQRVVINWLMVLLGFLLILALSSSVILIETVLTNQSGLLYSHNILSITSVIGLTGLMISPLFFPTILYGLPRIPVAEKDKNDESAPMNFNINEMPKVKSAGFEETYLMRVGQIIESCMNENRPYLKKDFSMVMLSVLTQIPVHHLAYFFREYLHLSFHDYRNRWRIGYAKNLIREGKTKELTLEAIGTESGFSSRNTFFIAFKRVEGISPGEYVRRSDESF